MSAIWMCPVLNDSRGNCAEETVENEGGDWNVFHLQHTMCTVRQMDLNTYKHSDSCSHAATHSIVTQHITHKSHSTQALTQNNVTLSQTAMSLAQTLTQNNVTLSQTAVPLAQTLTQNDVTCHKQQCHSVQAVTQNGVMCLLCVDDAVSHNHPHPPCKHHNTTRDLTTQHTPKVGDID